jgi:hypothetical protein
MTNSEFRIPNNELNHRPMSVFIRHSSFVIRHSVRGWLLALLLLLPASAQEPHGDIKRLILNDGTYESISQYRVDGDRVRYFSSERNSWEALPYSLIDWAATERYAAQAAHQASEKTRDELEKAAAERREAEARNPAVGPGIRLPSPDGVYLLDIYQSQPVLSLLAQNGAELNKNTKGNILRAVINPIAGPRQTVELKGPHAPIQSHESSPSIYFPIDPNDPSIGYDSKTASDHLRIVRCREAKGNRVVVAIDIAIYGKVKQQTDYIGSHVEAVSDYWVKVTPAVPLKPGEYALAEFDGKGAMNLFVWDFGVNPEASPNPDAVRAIPDRSEPVLIQKPKNKKNP